MEADRQSLTVFNIFPFLDERNVIDFWLHITVETVPVFTQCPSNASYVFTNLPTVLDRDKHVLRLHDFVYVDVGDVGAVEVVLVVVGAEGHGGEENGALV